MLYSFYLLAASNGGLHGSPIGILLILALIAVVVIIVFIAKSHRNRHIGNGADPSAVQIVLGSVFLTIGTVMTAWAGSQMKSLEYQLADAFDADDGKLVDLLFCSGLALLVLGLILLILGIVKKFITANKRIAQIPPNNTSAGATPPAHTEKDLAEHKYICMQCNHVSFSKISFCPECGSGDIKAYPPETPPEHTYQYCRRCGAQVFSTDEYCHQCGNKLK